MSANLSPEMCNLQPINNTIAAALELAEYRRIEMTDNGQRKHLRYTWSKLSSVLPVSA
jgi:hypothetical protein